MNNQGAKQSEEYKCYFACDYSVSIPDTFKHKDLKHIISFVSLFHVLNNATVYNVFLCSYEFTLHLSLKPNVRDFTFVRLVVLAVLVKLNRYLKILGAVDRVF